MLNSVCPALSVFQSTPPARGATSGSCRYPRRSQNFNPRPPRGGRLIPVLSTSVQPTISIHAPREGGDWRSSPPPTWWLYFNPRPPRGGRRDVTVTAAPVYAISIHAPREGGDHMTTAAATTKRIFQSTPPARGATQRLGVDAKARVFQSTPPARGATPVAAP